MTSGLCRSALAVGVSLILLIPLRPAAQQTATAPPPDLSGDWVLVPSTSEMPSDDRGDVSDERGPGMGGAPGGSGGGGFRGPFGMGSGGGRGGERPSEEEMRRMQELMRELAEPPRRFVITQTPDAVVFTGSDGRAVKYGTHGKDEKHQWTSATVTTRTRWELGALVMDIRADNRITVTRKFTMSKDPRQLTITTTMGRDRDGRSRTVIYEESLSAR